MDASRVRIGPFVRFGRPVARRFAEHVGDRKDAVDSGFDVEAPDCIDPMPGCLRNNSVDAGMAVDVGQARTVETGSESRAGVSVDLTQTHDIPPFGLARLLTVAPGHPHAIGYETNGKKPKPTTSDDGIADTLESPFQLADMAA